MTEPSFSGWQPVRNGSKSLVNQLADSLAQRIETHGLRPGTKLPSIRVMAEQTKVSRFTVVEAYDRLAARGLVQSRRGAGFYVSTRYGTTPRRGSTPQSDAGRVQPPTPIDVSWLLRSIFLESTSVSMPGGAGLLPSSWLDPGLVAAAVRSVGRTANSSLTTYGCPTGFGPLRQQLASRLQNEGVPAHPEHNLLTANGVTHAMDLVARLFIKPGDTVLVEDPAWFVIFGRLSAFGARLIGVPRGPEGPDMEQLERLAALHKPRLFIINSSVHNPTGFTLSPGSAYDILRLAEKHDFMVVEDDTYRELHPGGATRLASLDQLDRVILTGGFSKILAASLRVGYIAANAEIIRKLTDQKLLSGLTSPELGERVVHRVLAEGQYRRHVERVRARVDKARSLSIARLQALGLVIPHEPQAGMFIWADCKRDTETLARAAVDQGLLLAPGTLSSPTQAPSSMMRFSVAMADSPSAWETLANVLSI